MNKPFALLIDLDGTIYRGEQVIDGAIEFIQTLNQRKIPYLFVTNRGNRTPETVANSLNVMGVNCTAENILTSSMATAAYLTNNSCAYWIGEKGLDQAMQESGIEFDNQHPDVVIVGYDQGFDYQKLTLATRLILDGATFIATNDDNVITVEDGVIPEAGPLVEAVKKATGVNPKIIGKPHAPIIQAACNKLGYPAEQYIMVGDNLHTDILAGIKNGLRTAFVLTGVSKQSDLEKFDIQPTWTVNDLLGLSEVLFGD